LNFSSTCPILPFTIRDFAFKRISPWRLVYLLQEWQSQPYKKMTIKRSHAENQTLFDQKFSYLSDPRRREKDNLKYPLPEILFLTISAVTSGANTWTGIESFGESKIDWLHKFYLYKEGIPSHDAISDVLSILDASTFGECLISWVNSVLDISEGDIVSIDGKTIRGVASSGNNKYSVHIVSAYARERRIFVRQVAIPVPQNFLKQKIKVTNSTLKKKLFLGIIDF